jgi:intracellular septation protein A
MLLSSGWEEINFQWCQFFVYVHLVNFEQNIKCSLDILLTVAFEVIDCLLLIILKTRCLHLNINGSK